MPVARSSTDGRPGREQASRTAADGAGSAADGAADDGAADDGAADDGAADDGGADDGGEHPRGAPTRPQLPPLALAGPVVVAVVSALAYVAATYRYRRDWWRFLDLSIYRDGAETVLRGDPLYGGVQFLHNSWTNTPFTAVLYVPILAIHGEPVRLLALLGNLALLVAAVALTLLGLRVRVNRVFVAWLLLLAAMCLWIEPVLSTIRLGQVNLLLAVLVLADVVVLDAPLLDAARLDPPAAGGRGRRRRRWHGVGIGLAAGIKLTPALFVVYLLLRRRYRAAAVATGTALVTVLIGFAAAPSSSRAYWLHGTAFDAGRVGSLDSAVAQSLRSSVARELGSGPRIGAGWVVADLLTAVVGLLLAAAVARAGQEMLAIATVGLLACLVSPFSWSHHWVWFVPLLVVAAVAAGRRGSLTGWLPVVALGALLAGWVTGYGYPPLSDHGPHLGLIWQVDQPALRPVTTNLYPLIAYAVLATLVVLVLRERRTRRRDGSRRDAGRRNGGR